MELLVLSVNVGQPRPIGTINGELVQSAIAKQPIANTEIEDTPTNLGGDSQADLTVHGGTDKAIYAYSANHWPWWLSEHNLDSAPGTFGENLTITGATETTIHIGDQFSWGSALLEVSQPRQPCFKLNMHTAREDTSALLTISGRCGWYLRVREPGMAPSEAPLIRTLESNGPTIRDAFTAAFNRRTDAQTRQKIADHPALAAAWRATLIR